MYLPQEGGLWVKLKVHWFTYIFYAIFKQSVLLVHQLQKLQDCNSLEYEKSEQAAMCDKIS